jgi:serine/threonine-protein kinase
MGGRADPRTDIYTLGVLLYEMICGRRPYDTAGLDLLTDQLSGPPPPPSTHVDVPPEVDAVLMKCFHEDIEDRWATALDLSRALDQALEVAAPPPPAPPAPIARPPTAPPAPVVVSPPLPTEPPVLPAAWQLDDTEIKKSRLPLILIVLVVIAAGVAAFLLSR